MNHTLVNGLDSAPKSVRALAYARVSSKEQEKEGFSIDAQRKLLQAYAQEKSLIIAREFVDVESDRLSASMKLCTIE